MGPAFYVTPAGLITVKDLPARRIPERERVRQHSGATADIENALVTADTGERQQPLGQLRAVAADVAL